MNPPYDKKLPDGTLQNMLESEIEMIKKSEKMPPQKFKISGGLLENIIDKTDNTARNALIWQNPFFGKITRSLVRMPTPFHAVNSPLSLHPEILDEVLEYIFLPRDVVNAYREIAKEALKKVASDDQARRNQVKSAIYIE